MSAIAIDQPGMASTLQDAGRPGLAHLGVPTSGWVDAGLASLVNRLAGNEPGAAVIETCGGLTIQAVGDVLIVDSAELAPRTLRDGERHSLFGGHGRVWHYLAVRGGFETPTVLGSRATDTLSALCGLRIDAGVHLAIGSASAGPIHADHAPLRPLPTRVRIHPGPRLDWFESDVLTRITTGPWQVTTASRVGVRLAGTAPRRVERGELPSEGLVRGALQAPPDGSLMMMLADHPTTGGYPVLAVVDPDDVWIVAQTPAGQSLQIVM